MRYILTFVLIVQTAFAQVSLSEIKPEMQKFLSEHVTEKRYTPEIMARAISHFINDFDPQHVYLLQDDVKPYLTLSQRELQQLAAACEREDYAIFRKINTTIQESIRKLRLFRRTMVVKVEQFKEYSAMSLPVIAEAKQADVATFSANEVELQKVHAIYMAHLVGKELESFKALNRTLSFLDAVRDVELEMEEYENGYLYLNKEGKALPPQEVERLLAMHILKALTASLDLHSEFFDTKEAELLRMKLEKEYDGVGILIEQAGDLFVVGSLIKGSSAELSGKIQVGDEIVSLDQTKTKNLTLQEVEAALSGAIGTYVDVGFKRGSDKPFHVVLERRHTVIQEGRVDTTFEKVPGGIIGVIQLHAFYQGDNDVSSEQDVKNALQELEKKGKLLGLVLDLRDNRGGFLLQAVKVAGLFIKSGVIVAAKYSDGTLRYFRDTDPTVSYKGPLVVLTSKQTASAAEIVAQALQDYGVAVVVGDESTYGKGSIQTQSVTQEGGAESYFKVTIGRYYGVSGFSTQLQGVKSDIVIPGVLSEKKVGEAYHTETIKRDSIAPSFTDTLKDVDGTEKGWYEQYYLPYLQKKTDIYRKWIPELKKKSQERIAKDKSQQSLPADQKTALRTVLNAQLQEAMNIAEDLSNLSH